MIVQRILHIEAHRGYWPQISIKRRPRGGDVTTDGVLIGCPTCSTSGYLAVSPPDPGPNPTPDNA